MNITKKDLSALLARFKGKFAQRGKDECWLWPGAKTSNGYGYLVLQKNGRRMEIKAHRALVAHKIGFWPGVDIVACHHCDVRLCVNPAHVYAGTAATNIEDMMQRGGHRTKWVRGHRIGNHHMSDHQAKKALSLYFGANGNAAIEAMQSNPDAGTVKNIARRHNVSIPIVRNVIAGQKNIPRRPGVAELVRREWHGPDGQGRLADRGKTTARWTMKTIAAHLEVAEPVVRALMRGITYKHIKRPPDPRKDSKKKLKTFL